MKFAIVAALFAAAAANPALLSHGVVAHGAVLSHGAPLLAHGAPLVHAVQAPAGLGGNGFGFGGHFSTMPQPALVPVAQPYPVDAPYKVGVDAPFAAPYVAKVVQPHIHKQTVVSSHVGVAHH